MVFSSITFLFYFLPIVLALYYIVPKSFKNIVLLISSTFFYYFGEPKYIVIMIVAILVTYIFALLIDKHRKYSKIFFWLAILVDVGFLVYFKYANFIIENINLYISNKIDFIYVVLPIGISFYTFQLLSYLIDVYREDAKVQKNFFKLAMYISLFPQLIAGPIVRYTDIEKQIDERTHSFEKFSLGVRRFIIGLGKKVLLANVLGELGEIFLNSNDTSLLFFWMYGIAISLQIYFDFSGYSDMAIGLGKMFGFDFLENFNYPYIATSITDFWRRWHISLSSWFRDYIYITLGGNKVSKIKWLRNILIVWCLTGLWHGAAWNFVIWGLYFGILLILEKLFLGKLLEKIPKIFSRIYVLIIVIISFIIFQANNLENGINTVLGLFGITSTISISLECLYYFKSYFIILIVSIIGATPIMKNLILKIKSERILNILEMIFLAVIFTLSISYIISGSFNPFLYFRF